MAEIIGIDEAMEAACAAILAGEPVALPTETVYGLAADATNGEAAARIFEAKGRPSFNPLIVHVADLGMASRFAEIDDYVSHMAHAFWPGPLTLVLPARKDSAIHALVTAGLDTVAIRVPRGFARELIRKTGKPLAAPSANMSGRLSPTTADAVAQDIGDRIGLIVDGGATAFGLESTIVKVEPLRAILLRPGGVTVEEIEAATGGKVEPAAAGGAVEAPGMLASHYAPRARLRLDASEVRPGEAFLAYGEHPVPGEDDAVMALNLSNDGRPREAAKNLFAYLRALDASGAATIAVQPIPADGLGMAINDRLRRAAAPRIPVSGHG